MQRAPRVLAHASGCVGLIWHIAASAGMRAGSPKPYGSPSLPVCPVAPGCPRMPSASTGASSLCRLSDTMLGDINTSSACK